MQRRTLAALVAGATLALSAGAQAQDYPTRPIKWIVPYLAGTAPDTTVRIVADAMDDILKQPIVIENKGGAAGNLGAQVAAKAAPDGYTWVYSASPMATSMRMYRKPGFDVMKDFVHVGRIAQSDVLLVVNAESGITSVQQLVERGRKDPGKLTFASGGVGSPAHMGGELMLNATGMEALHVPYKGASESATAVMGKQVDYALTIFSVSLPHIHGGKMNALAVMGPKRNPQLPKVPTAAEAGLPGINLVSFGGLSMPAGTPAPIVKRVSEALNQALADPQVRAKLEANGSLVAPSTPQEYTENLQAEIGNTEAMMKAAKIEAQ
ncbi:Bug family tripartite tricarboxylate transporter substrate binding protein [Ramlibacter rhizophilus]|uniref:Tripartite tricarboxylate transporter substrate binding protein n=1 Tax=Ramlibacter rhizophilus TaxID=1781167 RepID=A0A4Z0BZV2_9BURK|nr:tripartite tricarboxylate transporter substrate binding protein [Ramlibacter rhizophilus]TFZ03489.1 tripartite tricarboxylate transporter substrate binding protein [Ramlibacter rhizophilus]